MAAAGPTAKSVEEDLGELTNEVKDLSRGVDALRNEVTGFRASAETQLGFIKWVGVFFAGILVALVGTSINVAWNASALNSEVKAQGGRLDKVESRLDKIDGRLDGIGKQLEAILRQTAPKAGN
jgi:archaellum component FlaC